MNMAELEATIQATVVDVVAVDAKRRNSPLIKTSISRLP